MLNTETFIKLLADPTRLRCLMLLLQEEELCVCELTHALDDIQPKISRHLATLRDNRLVLDRRAGQWIYYRINPDLPLWAADILEATLRGAREQKTFADDRKKLQQMPSRPENRQCA